MPDEGKNLSDRKKRQIRKIEERIISEHRDSGETTMISKEELNKAVQHELSITRGFRFRKAHIKVIMDFVYSRGLEGYGNENTDLFAELSDKLEDDGLDMGVIMTDKVKVDIYNPSH